MGSHRAYVGRLTIAEDGEESNVLAATELKMARALVFSNPAAFTNAVALYGAMEEGTDAADHKAVEVNGSAIALTAGVIEQWDISGVVSIKLVSADAEAAERVVDVYAILEI